MFFFHLEYFSHKKMRSKKCWKNVAATHFLHRRFIVTFYIKLNTIFLFELQYI